MLLWGLVLQAHSTSTEAESMVCLFQIDGVTPAFSKEKPGTSQAWKKTASFLFDDTCAGTGHLCSSETGSSLVWEVLLDARAFTEVSKGLVRAWLTFGGRRKGLWFPKKRGSPHCITLREAWGCFLCLTHVFFGTDYGIWDNVAVSPERLGEIFDLM